MGNFHLPRCFHYVVKLIFFFGYSIATFSFYFIFLIFCVCKVSLFSLNNGIQFIALVFCYTKVLLDLFNFLLQICDNIVINNNRLIPRKNSKRNKKLDLLNTFFATAYKSFHCWCSIDKKVSVVSAVLVLALNAGIGSSISISLKCGIGTPLNMTTKT